MKKIVLIALIASSAIFAEAVSTDMVTDVATAKAKEVVVTKVKEVVTEATTSESNVSDTKVKKEENP